MRKYTRKARPDPITVLPCAAPPGSSRRAVSCVTADARALDLYAGRPPEVAAAAGDV